MAERSERARTDAVHTKKGEKTSSHPENKAQKNYREIMSSVEPLRSSYKYLYSSNCIAKLTAKHFFTAPASTRFHGSYQGGLFVHSLKVTQVLLELTRDNHLIWNRPESPYIIGMFHDICKIDAYLPNIDLSFFADGEPTGYIHNKETALKGHGDKSVMMLSEYTTLTEEEIMCIRYHMGAFTDKEEWELYTNAIHRYPNVLWTHQADMIASHIYGT